MANPKGTPENLRPKPFPPGVSGNPGGLPKEAAQIRVISQRMWGLYWSDDPEYDELKKKYPRLARQIEARDKQAEEGHNAAIARVDGETVGPLDRNEAKSGPTILIHGQTVETVEL